MSIRGGIIGRRRSGAVRRGRRSVVTCKVGSCRPGGVASHNPKNGHLDCVVVTEVDGVLLYLHKDGTAH